MRYSINYERYFNRLRSIIEIQNFCKPSTQFNAKWKSRWKSICCKSVKKYLVDQRIFAEDLPLKASPDWTQKLKKVNSCNCITIEYDYNIPLTNGGVL